MNPCLADNLRAIDQGLRLLRGLDDDEYVRVDAHGIRCAIGPHVRHVVDHYECLLRGLRAGAIDYDARRRSPTLEVDRGAAIAALEAIARALPELVPTGTGEDRMDGRIEASADAPTDLAVHVRLRAGAHGEVDLGVHPSSLTRELHSLHLHTIHHYAMIAMILRARGLACETELGVAPATLGHRRAGAST